MEITVGHERRLKALGLSASWYLETFQRLGGKCERCGKPETKMHYGQPKPLAVDTSMNPPRLLCQKCSVRKNKTKQRRREMQKADAEAERLANMTRDEFWNENRKKLKKTERERLEQSTDEVLFMCDVMDDYINGTDGTTPQDLQDTIAEVAAEVAQHGLCDLNVALIEWWRPHEKAFFDAVIERGGATEKFVKFGFLDALPSDVYHRFAERFMQKKTNPISSPQYVLMSCANALHCGDHGRSVPESEVARYKAVGKTYLCHICIDGNKHSAELASAPATPPVGMSQSPPATCGSK